MFGYVCKCIYVCMCLCIYCTQEPYWTCTLEPTLSLLIGEPSASFPSLKTTLFSLGLALEAPPVELEAALYKYRPTDTLCMHVCTCVTGYIYIKSAGSLAKPLR